MQRTFTGLKIAGLLALIGAGLLSPHTAAPAAAPPLAGMHFGVAMAACLMAYNGWSYVSFVAGEVRDPHKNLLRSLVLGMAAVAVLYVSANVAYLKVMTVAQIAATDRVGADLATRTLGPIGGTLVSLTVLLSIIGAVNGCILTGARIPFAQARDGLFFARFGERTSAISDPRLRHRVQRNLDGDPGPHRVLRDALFLLDPGRVDLLHHDGRCRFRPAAQAAGRTRARTGCGVTRIRSGCSWRYRSGSWRTRW